jgi:N6-adenosine-specific RNA methylase IME4
MKQPAPIVKTTDRDIARPIFLREEALRLLNDAKTLTDVLKVKHAAQAAEHYFKGATKARDIAADAAEIRLRAERKAGELLREMRLRGERDAGRGGNRKSQSHSVTVKLPDLGVTKMQAFRWQEIAAVDEKIFDGYISEAKKKESHELTTSGLKTVAKFDNKNKQAEAIAKRPEVLPEGPFNVIVIDPPWAYANRRPTVNDSRGYPEYAGMSLEEIGNLAIKDLAADDAVLWLWTTNAFLRDALDLCAKWEFQYRTLLTWAKNKIGLGDWLRGQTEHCLMASRGKPLIKITNQSTLLQADVGEHSAKPDEFYALVENLCPTPKGGRIDVFARKPRDGWRLFGYEAPK